MDTLITQSSKILDRFSIEEDQGKIEIANDLMILNKTLEYYKAHKKEELMFSLAHLAKSIMLYCNLVGKNINLDRIDSKPIENSDEELIVFIMDIIESGNYKQSMEILNAIANKYDFKLTECISLLIDDNK